MAQSLVLSSLKEAIKTERPPSLTGSNTDSQNLRIYNTYMIKMNKKTEIESHGNMCFAVYFTLIRQLVVAYSFQD